jgi:hypothetical protein
MRPWLSTALVLVAAAWFTGGARGQNFPLGNPGMLIQQKSVQQELKMTEEQIKKAGEIPQKIRGMFQDEGQKLKRDPEWAKKRQELMKERVMAELHKAVAAILTPEQLKRLRQISLQENGPMAFGDPEVEKALQLTADQKAKIKAINEDFMTHAFKILDIREGGLKTDTNLTKVRKETVAKITALLSDKQRETYTGLIGEPFEVKKDRRVTSDSDGGKAPAGARPQLTAPLKRDLASVEKRMQELEPTREERRVDDIGWAKDLREAARLSKAHNRPMFIFTYDGNVRTGRC